jgi:sterol desaturase/sphingolipid hydroxylase (fatty acid hydroxylase superfamily)
MIGKPSDAQDLPGRNERGEWRPDGLLEKPPLFVWPPRPGPLFKWLFGYPGFLFPWNVGYIALAVVTWLYLTPDMARMQEFHFDWISLVFIRNVGLLTAFAGIMQFRLYTQQAQGKKYKYNGRWLSKKNSTFMFGNQVLDNMFWNIFSGCTFWTAYECITLWAYANNYLPHVNFDEHPIYFVVLMAVILVWRDFYQYWIHRFIHWEPLYNISHYVHHKNVNVGPWSGLAMHPIEHMFYFGVVLIHWVLPSHPLHIIFTMQHAGLAPAQAHAGFDEIEVTGGRKIANHNYIHYLHHRYHTVNYGGDGTVPLDEWFGTFHDGSDDATAAVLRSRREGGGGALAVARPPIED